MKAFGKGLFWIGFILLMGVVVAYLILMAAGALKTATWVTDLTIIGAVLLGGLLMLLGRASERKGETKQFNKTLAAEKETTANSKEN